MDQHRQTEEDAHWFSGAIRVMHEPLKDRHWLPARPSKHLCIAPHNKLTIEHHNIVSISHSPISNGFCSHVVAVSSFRRCMSCRQRPTRQARRPSNPFTSPLSCE